jgi:hypothetical protein
LAGRKEVYLKEILNQVPRIMGQLCRLPSMKTYGCFDRPYWNYGDYGTPRTRRQEAVLTLALLYTIDHEDNHYYKNAMLLEWIKAAIDYWTTLQLRTGAFNELYPNEFNYTSTAFTSFAVSESLMLLKGELSLEQSYLDTLRKAAEWLTSQREGLVINHDTGAVVFLYNMFLLTGDEKYSKYAEDKFNYIASSQDSEGWFNEYGGPDIGYLSLSIDYLAKYYQKSRNENVLPVVNKAIEFLSLFVHPNTTYGGEYASRNTEYLMPDGFEILSTQNEMANAIAEVIADAIRNRCAVTPLALDDKFLLYNGYDYLQAYVNNKYESADTTILPHNGSFYRYFNNSRIAVRSNEEFYSVANGNKGGALYVYFRGSGKSMDDSGVLVQTDGGMLTSCLLNKENNVEVSKNVLNISGKLGRPFDNKMTETKFLALRAFQMTFGRIQAVSLGVKEFLRKVLITRSRSSQYGFEREIIFDRESVTIVDKIDNHDGIRKVSTCVRLDTIYGEVCRFFKEAELDSQPVTVDLDGRDRNMKMIVIKRVYDTAGGLVHMERKKDIE